MLLSCKCSLIVTHGLFQFCDFFALGIEEPHADLIGLIHLTSFEKTLVQYGILIFERLLLPAEFLVGSQLNPARLVDGLARLLQMSMFVHSRRRGTSHTALEN